MDTEKLYEAKEEIEKHATEAEFPIDDSVIVVPTDKWDKFMSVLHDFLESDSQSN